MSLPVYPNPISMSQIQTEFGGSNPISLVEYYAGGPYVPQGTYGYPNGYRTLIPTSGPLSLGNFHGAVKTVYLFVTSSSNVYVPAGCTRMDIWMVGSGGGGGGNFVDENEGGGGGGGGEVVYATGLIVVPGDRLSCGIGPGGTGATFSTQASLQGSLTYVDWYRGSTLISSVAAGGGGCGASVWGSTTQYAQPGGSGGGGCGYHGRANPGASYNRGTSGNWTRLGGAGASGKEDWWSGGGGGASSPAFYDNSGRGGDGFLFSPGNGYSYVFGSGGGAAGGAWVGSSSYGIAGAGGGNGGVMWNPGQQGNNGYGGGGGGGSYAAGGNGGSGGVFLKFYS